MVQELSLVALCRSIAGAEGLCRGLELCHGCSRFRCFADLLTPLRRVCICLRFAPYLATPRFVLQIHMKGCNESCHASILSSHCTRARSTLAGAIATSGTPPPGRRGAPGCNGACQCAQSAQSGSPRRSRRCVSARHLRAAACRQPRCVAPGWLGEASAWSRATCLWHAMHHSILVLPQSSARFIQVAFASAFIILYSVWAPRKQSGSHSRQLPRCSGNTLS